MSSTKSPALKSRIHIGIDGNEANVVNRVGSNQYAYLLLKAIYLSDSSARFTIYLKDKPVGGMPKETESWTYRVLKPTKAWTQWRLPLDLYLSPQRPQVFFTPGHYAPRKSPIPTVVTVLDLAFLKFPNLFLKHRRGVAQLSSWTKYSVEHASHVITISQSTKQDVLSTYGVDQSQVTVAYPGINLARFAPSSKESITKIKQKYQLSDKYLLYVGTIQPRKNLDRLLKAFESLPRKFNRYQLVIAGAKGWMSESFEAAIQQSKKKDLIRSTGYVDPVDLPTLYSGAQSLLLVGLHEGFGIPPAESIACGTIPVVSNTAALPEVVGEAGITVDPYSVTSIRHGIISVSSLTKDKRKLRLSKMQQHISQFTWDNAAQKVLSVLYELALQG